MTGAPRLSPVQVEVLTLLRSREMYGLELVRESRVLKRGTVYVTLERMADRGLVSSRQVEEQHQSGLPRRLYSVTGVGRAALAAHEAAGIEFARGAWA